METCPHGRRIVCVEDGVVFLDACEDCANVLAELGFSLGRQVAADPAA